MTLAILTFFKLFFYFHVVKLIISSWYTNLNFRRWFEVKFGGENGSDFNAPLFAEIIIIGIRVFYFICVKWTYMKVPTIG